VPTSAFVVAINPVCLLMYLICFIEWIVKELRPIWPAFHNLFEKGPGLRQLSRLVHRMFAHKVYRHIPKVIITLFEVYMFVAVIVYVWCYAWVSHIGTINWSSWSFGQILALTIWAPVISKYVYWTLCRWSFYLNLLVGTDISSSRHQVIL
jgi:hypothetical protein